MKAIYSRNRLGFIGLNGALVSPNAADLQHFARLTKRSHRGNDMPLLLCGWRTYAQLLQQQITLTGRRLYCDKEDGLHPYLHKFDWCIGGRATYEKYAPYFTELHISNINDSTQGDVLEPTLANLNPDCKIFEYDF